jgi:hypothetical protein
MAIYACIEACVKLFKWHLACFGHGASAGPEIYGRAEAGIARYLLLLTYVCWDILGWTALRRCGAAAGE